MRRVGVSFAAAAVLVGGFILVLNPARLAARLADADPVVFSLGLVSVVLAVACWGEATRRLCVASGASLSRRRAFVAYGAGVFGKQVIPMGNAGGPAVMAYAFDRETEMGYGRTLAVVAVAEFLSLAASLVLAAVGLIVVVSLGAPASAVRWVGLGIAAVTAALALICLLAWYRRAGVGALLASGAAFVHPVVARVDARVAARLEPDRVTRGVVGAYATVDDVLANRRALRSAAALTQLGWLCFAAPLYTSALALDLRLSVGLVLFAVPAAGVATVLPLPGGLGGVEVAMVGLLTALAALDVTAAAAVVILYRLCSFWFFALVGGLCTLVAAATVPELTAALDDAPGLDAAAALDDRSASEDVDTSD